MKKGMLSECSDIAVEAEVCTPFGAGSGIQRLQPSSGGEFRGEDMDGTSGNWVVRVCTCRVGVNGQKNTSKYDTSK